MDTLSGLVEQRGPLQERDAAGWVVRLARRIEELHVLGVAHGSVSAALIGADQTSCESHGRLRDVRDVVDAPAYHSPERLAGGGISRGDDAWALAVTLYYLLTGQLPYAGSSDEELLERIHAAAPAPLAVFDVGDDGLQALLEGALVADEAARELGVQRLRCGLEGWRPADGLARLPGLEDDEDHTESDFDEESGGATLMLEPGLIGGPEGPTPVAVGHVAAGQVASPRPPPARRSRPLPPPRPAAGRPSASAGPAAAATTPEMPVVKSSRVFEELAALDAANDEPDDEAATLMLESKGADLSAAIEAALSSAGSLSGESGVPPDWAAEPAYDPLGIGVGADGSSRPPGGAIVVESEKPTELGGPYLSDLPLDAPVSGSGGWPLLSLAMLFVGALAAATVWYLGYI